VNKIANSKILVVDDEQDLLDILSFNLRAAGIEVDALTSAEDVLQSDISAYSLILLDVMMEGMSGFQLAKHLKSNDSTSNIPIIFLTAKDSEDDTLRGFKLGAEDYIKKPFSVREVVARVKRSIDKSNNIRTAQSDFHVNIKGKTKEKRSGLFKSSNNNQFSFISTNSKFYLDVSRKSLIVEGKNIKLTRTEFDLMRCLMDNQGHVMNRQDLIDQVWRHDVIVSDRAVDVNIARLRKKMGKYGNMIVSRQGFGYLLEE